MHTGALVPRRGTTAGVSGPRRDADECDAGWFAPVATRRRSMLGPFWALAGGSQCFPGGHPRTPGRSMLGPFWALAGGSQCFPGGHPRTPGTLYARAFLGPRRGLAVFSRGTPPDPRVALCARVLGPRSVSYRGYSGPLRGQAIRLV